ncbi:FUSC family protein [Dermatophilaceae bacterium Soc4.6]
MSSPASARSRDLLVSGRSRLSVEARDARDRVLASDPGLTRLRQGVSALLAVATTVAVEAVFVRLVGASSQTGLLGILLGAVVAMPLSTSVRESDRRTAVVTVASGAVAAALGAVVGVTTAQVHVLGLVAFTVVTFVAVWLRRFGPRWFTLGFLGWQAFFFSLFLDPPVAALPFMVAAIVLATGWVGVLLVTVLRVDPGVALTRTVTALRARARAAISTAIDVLDSPHDLKAVRAMRGQLVALSEVSLLLDGQLSQADSLPAHLSPGFMRRWVVDIEVALDEVCGAVLDLSQLPHLPEGVRHDVRAVLGSVGWAPTVVALEHARALQSHGHEGVVPARRLGAAAVLLLETVDELDHPALRPDRSDEVLDDPQFEPVVTLFSGNLPGSAPLAEQTHAREGARRWSPSRWRLSTRQAVQAAVAAGLSIVIGDLISPQRYYWAVIASFIAFTGTSTAGETIRKSLGRITGTVAGLVVAVALANVTAGSTVMVLASLGACIFFAFYLQAVSYTGMTFFITLMLGELYALLHTFTDSLLLLRLEETAVGAVVGIGVCVVVLPSGTRATLRVARRSFLTALADLLAACADHLEGVSGERDLIALVVRSGAAARQVVRTHQALTRGRVFGAGREALQHRISVLGSADAVARTLAARVEASPAGSSPALARACRLIEAEARRLVDLPTLITSPPRTTGEGISERVGAVLDAMPSDPATDRVRVVVRRLADSLALLTPRSS